MNKKLAMNMFLIEKYTQAYVKATGRMKEKLEKKLQELQKEQTDLVKSFK